VHGNGLPVRVEPLTGRMFLEHCSVWVWLPGLLLAPLVLPDQRSNWKEMLPAVLAPVMLQLHSLLLPPAVRKLMLVHKLIKPVSIATTMLLWGQNGRQHLFPMFMLDAPPHVP
jgi:hypothetical protein